MNPIVTASAIPRNSVESDHGYTSRIYFDYAGDNVTLTSLNHVNIITSVIAGKNSLNEVIFFTNNIAKAIF